MEAYHKDTVNKAPLKLIPSRALRHPHALCKTKCFLHVLFNLISPFKKSPHGLVIFISGLQRDSFIRSPLVLMNPLHHPNLLQNPPKKRATQNTLGTTEPNPNHQPPHRSIHPPLGTNHPVLLGLLCGSFLSTASHLVGDVLRGTCLDEVP